MLNYITHPNWMRQVYRAVARRRGWLVVLLSLSLLVAPSVRAQQPVTIENSELRVALSPQHGGLVSVQSKRREASYLGSAPQTGWFRIQIPLPFWEGHAAQSSDQKNITVRKRGPDTAELTTKQLRSKEGTYAISVNVTLRLERDNLVCRLNLTNQSQQTVDRISFPILAVPPAADSKDVLVMPQTSLPLQAAFNKNDIRTDHNPFALLDPGAGWFLTDPLITAKAYTYPNSIPTAWIALDGGGKGVGIDVRDSKLQFQRFIIERRLYRDTRSAEDNRQDYNLSWNWYPLVRPASSWESPDVYIKFDSGDWHEIARQHREFMKKQVSRPLIAKTFQSSIGWMSRGVSNYDQIPAIAQQGLDVGAPYFIVYRWSEAGAAGMVWGAYPRKDLGGLASLRTNLEKARELGAHPLAWFNGTLSGDDTLDHLAQGKDMVSRDRWGSGIAGGQWTYGPENNVWLEFDPTGSKDLEYDTIRRFIEDYHFSGFEMDQAYKFYLSYRDPKVPPELAFPMGYGDFYRRVDELVKKHDPDGIIVGEGYSDWLDQYVDSSWVFSGGALDVAQLTRLRYSLPWITVPVRADARNPGHANQAFMLNAPLDIFDDLSRYPDYAKHLQKLHALKKLTTGYFYQGEFSDVDNFSLDGPSQVLARSYVDPAGKFVTAVVVNTSGQPQKATLRPAGDFATRKVRHYYLDGRDESEDAAGQRSLNLQGFDVQVLAFEKP